jgi:hypothetical protein
MREKIGSACSFSLLLKLNSAAANMPKRRWKAAAEIASAVNDY